MKKTLLILSIALLGVFLSSPVMGQTNNSGAITQNLSLGLREVALLSASATPISLVLVPDAVGLAVKSSVSDSSARLIISSVITSATRTLSASVSAIPPGTTIKMQALVPNTNFKGTQGTYLPAATLPLTSGTAVDIITGIGSCYSGNATGDGYRLRYIWGLNLAEDYSLVKASGGTSVTVTLTISAAV